MYQHQTTECDIILRGADDLRAQLDQKWMYYRNRPNILMLVLAISPLQHSETETSLEMKVTNHK